MDGAAMPAAGGGQRAAVADLQLPLASPMPAAAAVVAACEPAAGHGLQLPRPPFRSTSAAAPLLDLDFVRGRASVQQCSNGPPRVRRHDGLKGSRWTGSRVATWST